MKTSFSVPSRVCSPTYVLEELLKLGEDNGPLPKVFAFFGVAELLKMKKVSRKWRGMCTRAINSKCPDPPKAFQSNQELKDAITKWCTYDPEAMEELACTYGYPINRWDVSRVTDFSGAFDGKSNFNDYIGDWDVSNATNMEAMFCTAMSFNQPLTNWNTSKVTTMNYMFLFAYAFNQPVNHFDTSRVTNMESTFELAISFNQSLISWDTSHVTTMCGMFCTASAFNQSLASWDTSQVSNMGLMFFDARAFDQCLASWNCSNVTENEEMFGTSDVIAFSHFATLPEQLRNWEVDAR